MWHPAKLALGSVITAGFVAYYAALEASCANMSTRDDGGELIVTSGGTAKGTQTGVRLLAPRFAWSGKIPPNGTVEARLLRIENLCDAVLDCSSFPPQLRSSFNASVLDGALLICDTSADARLNYCGGNRLARALGRTGLVGISEGSVTGNPFKNSPGYGRNLFRLGVHRDGASHGGGGGIPFQVAHGTQYAFNPILEALDNDA